MDKMQTVILNQEENSEVRLIYGDNDEIMIAEMYTYSAGPISTTLSRLPLTGGEKTRALTLSHEAMAELVAMWNERNGVVPNEGAVAKLIQERDALQGVLDATRETDAHEITYLEQQLADAHEKYEALNAYSVSLGNDTLALRAQVAALEEERAKAKAQESWEIALLKDVLSAARQVVSGDDIADLDKLAASLDKLAASLTAWDEWKPAPNTTPKDLDWSPDGYCPECDMNLPNHSKSCALKDAAIPAQGGK